MIIKVWYNELKLNDKRDDKLAFEIKARQALIVYVNNLRSIRQLRRFGTVEYVSKKMRYVVLYTDQEDIRRTHQNVGQLKFVKKVLYSNWPLVDPNMSDLKAAGIYNQEIDKDDR